MKTEKKIQERLRSVLGRFYCICKRYVLLCNPCYRSLQRSFSGFWDIYSFYFQLTALSLTTGCGWKVSWRNFRWCYDICLEWMEKTIKLLSRDNRCEGWKRNQWNSWSCSAPSANFLADFRAVKCTAAVLYKRRQHYAVSLE